MGNLGGNVYVTTLYGVSVFNSDGLLLKEWGSFGDGDGQFDGANDIAVDESGNVYVVDIGNLRVQKFNSNGDFLTEWGSFGDGDGEFIAPWTVAVDGSGRVYVDDGRNLITRASQMRGHNIRIQIFNSSGEFLTKWGSSGDGDGQFEAPAGIAVDASGNIYVADTENHRVQKFGLSEEP